MYKFLITAPDGRKLYKSGPVCQLCGKRPGTASITTDISHFKLDRFRMDGGTCGKGYEQGTAGCL